ncbi:MAG: dTDP-4-dehydrorhamnose 3,5-epimerase [Sedimentisphaerales bacterium]|nr:dTDP-4-dehydrorhamnose 3,5-epimerase [Sedimentisphaerales bacterium]
MEAIQTELEGVIVVQPKVLGDTRGFFLETYHQGKYAEAGISGPFLQDNHSRSQRGVVRGLHYQLNHAQGKLVYCVRGAIFDVAVDIRRGSATFGKWFSVELSEKNRRQIYIPQGFAHGFMVLSDWADVYYKCTDVYHPGDDYGLFWADEHIGIAWPGDVGQVIVSSKDAANPRLREVEPNLLPE